MSDMLINLAGIIVIGLIVWWFWRSRPKARRATGAGPIEILSRTACKTPARIEVPAGKTATLRFRARTRAHAPRKFYSMCSV